MSAISAEAPTSYQDMIWQEFFTSRGRGLTLHAHFPWLIHASADTRYILASHGEVLVGGLALRIEQSAHGRVGSIGLVCVDPEHRGRNISTQLLNATVDTARSLGLAALRLWTQKPGVYARAGFESADLAVFGTVTPPATTLSEADLSASDALVRRDLSPTCGIPAFAVGVERVEHCGTSLTLIQDHQGLIVSEWQGDDAAVASLMCQVLPMGARLNAFAGQRLLEVLANTGWQLSLTQSRLQMILPLDRRTASAWADLSRVPVTARI